jgi:acid stress chaperone HdeB
MSKKLSGIASSLVLIVAYVPAAKAQVLIDIAKITCNQYVAYKVTNPKNISIWLSGYYSARGNNTVVDAQSFESSMEKLRDYCITHPKEPVMQAANTLLVEKK